MPLAPIQTFGANTYLSRKRTAHGSGLMTEIGGKPTVRFGLKIEKSGRLITNADASWLATAQAKFRVGRERAAMRA